MIEDIRNYRIKDLEIKFKELGVESYRARQVFQWLYQKGVDDFSLMTNVPSSVREKISQVFEIQKVRIEKIQTSRDLTQKFLLQLEDGSLIESVSIPVKSRMTACLSTQVGCKYACAFCASGTMGFKRNLSAAEILAQFLAVKKNVPQQKISHVVFMGVGEPLDNYDQLLKAVHILNSEMGVNLGIRKMTISTCGLAPAIERLSQEGLEIELSVSLHAATDQKRSELLPVNNKYPLKILRKAVEKYIEATHRKPTFEYVLLGEYNTAVEDAETLVKFMRGLNARVNLIPYNPASSRVKYQAPTKLEVLFFKNYLSQKGIDVTLRMPRGADINAACGQLRFSEMKQA